MLVLDTGGHMALIMSVVFSPDGRQIVSASNDKTIRIWDLDTGKTTRILRGEIAQGDEGTLYAMALSPDGQRLAGAGWTKNNEIRLYDFSSGQITALLNGHEDVVFDIVFSPDGRHLMSGSGDFTAIIWDLENGNAKYRLSGHQDDIYAVLFTADGAHAVTGSLDRDLRLWSVGHGREIARLPGHVDGIRSLAIAPDGTIASGDESGEIRLWDCQTRSPKAVMLQNSKVPSLSFNPNGRLLLSGADKGTDHSCHVYDSTDGREIVTYDGHDNVVLATAISPDGRWAATGGGNNHSIHIWDLRTGQSRIGSDRRPLTLGGRGQTVYAVAISLDGRKIAWGTEWRQRSPFNRGPLEMVLTLPGSASAFPSPQPLNMIMTEEEMDFCRAAAAHGDWSLEHRGGGQHGYDNAILDVKLGAHAVISIERDATDGYGHSTYSFAPDGETIISGGGNGVLAAYGRDGRRLGDFIGHGGDVCAVAPSPDGRLLLSGADDQTIRLWNLKTREPLVTLFHGKDGEWVMWTPQGYYISSPDGDGLIGWQINRGSENAADYVRASQLSKRLYRPDIIARTIELASAEAALRDMGEALDITELLRVSRPPEFRILRPESGSTFTLTPASVVVEVEPNPDPVEGYVILVNGRQVATRDLRFFSGHGSQPEKKPLSVPLQRGQNDIRITAHNRIGTATRKLRLHFAGTGELDKRGTLYLVAIGVDDYTHSKGQSLRFAGADARAFVGAMHRHAGPLHQRVEARLLAQGGGDLTPTRENIENTMLLFRDAKPEDTVALFLAGHGAYDGPNYVFLPQDTGSDGRHFLPASVVRWHVFQEALQGARGRRLMFVDTCHSGGAYNMRLVKEAHDAEIIVFSATDSETLALELADLGHGAFTFALVQGLSGEADPQRHGEVELFALQSYVSRQVKSLTNGSQAPTIHLSGVKDFVIALK